MSQNTMRQSAMDKSSMDKNTPDQDNLDQHAYRQPLIFTERRLLPRLFDTLMTLIAWAGFIWLLYLGFMSMLHAEAQTGVTLLGQTFGTVTLYIMIAVLNSLLLIIWAKYNQLRFSTERRTRRQALPDAQLTQHFGLTPQVLEQLKQAQIVVVQHNNDGTALEISVKRQETALAS